MKTIPVESARANLKKYLLESKATGPIVITHKGQPIGELTPRTDQDDLEMMVIASTRKFQAMLKRSLKSRTIPAEEFWKLVKQQTKSKASNGAKKRSVKRAKVVAKPRSRRASA